MSSASLFYHIPCVLLMSFLTLSPFAVFVIPESAVLEMGLSLPGFKAAHLFPGAEWY